MKAKLIEDFSCYYCGKKVILRKGEKASGWVASRAIAAGKAVPYTYKRKEPQDESKSDAS